MCFCPPCAIVQTDREVRAREGEAKLRTNKNFVLEPVISQLAPVEPMRYMSPRATEDSQGVQSQDGRRSGMGKRWSTEKALQSRRSALERLHSEEMASSSKNIKPHDPEKALRDMSNQSFELRDYPSTGLSKKNGPKASSKGKGKMIDVSMYEVGEEIPDAFPRPMGFISEDVKDIGRPEQKEMVISASKSPDGEHNLSDCDTITAQEPVFEEHTLQECAPKTSYLTPRVQQHSLLDCDTVLAKSSIAYPQHVLVDCETITRRSSYSNPQHRLKSCTTMPSESLDLSYVHDFTDCPVDKSVLAHFEKEEKRLQQAHDQGQQSDIEDNVKEHRLTSCSEIYTFSPGSPNEHRLDTCAVIPKEITGSPREHRMASCPTIASLGPTEIPKEHRLVSCPDTTSMVENPSLRQHRLVSCPAPVSTQISHRPSLETLREHRLNSCPTPSATDSEDNGTECVVGKHIHTEKCLKEGVHHHDCLGDPKEPLQRVAQALETSTLIPVPSKKAELKNEEQAEEKSKHGNNNHRGRRRRKSQGKAAEILRGESSHQRPRESDAQAALEKLLAAASPGAKKEAREKATKTENVKDGRGFDESAASLET